jgi:hypothetical protein
VTQNNQIAVVTGHFGFWDKLEISGLVAGDVLLESLVTFAYFK